MKGKEFVKKVLKNLSIFILVCIVWFAFWLGFSFVLYKIFGENENIQLLIIVIVSLILGVTIGIRGVKKAKRLQTETKQNIIENQITTIIGIIVIFIVTLIVCIILKFKLGIIISLSFIGAFLVWELGAIFAHKSLKKDIESINQKLKER